MDARVNGLIHFEATYPKLHALAEKFFRRQASTCTLQATALVHEVYLRFAAMEPSDIRGHEHFMALAASAMHQILIDKARRRKATKRNAGSDPITLMPHLVSGQGSPCDVLIVHDLISRLAQMNARQARIVEMRIFADMTVCEIAAALDVSNATVERDWRQARAWMRTRLGGGCA